MALVLETTTTANELQPLLATSTAALEASKQATKALKCVASTSKQVSELLARKHERIIKRICSISEEIESLKGDVMENITHQRERRQQLSEIEEDVDQAQLLGNGTLVEELLEELRVLQDETKREDSLYRALCKTVKSRKQSQRQFLRERACVEEEIRGFACKQKLIQTLLATCSKQSHSLSDDTHSSSASSQSDCGASALEDEENEQEEANDEMASHSSGSCSSDDHVETSREKWLAKAHSLDAVAPSTTATATATATAVSPARPKLRVRSMSTDCVQQIHPSSLSTSHHHHHTLAARPRRSLSVHFAPSPVLTAAVAAPDQQQQLLADDLQSLDIAGYMASIDETKKQEDAVVAAPVPVAQPVVVTAPVAAAPPAAMAPVVVTSSPAPQQQQPQQQPQQPLAIGLPVETTELAPVRQAVNKIEATLAKTTPLLLLEAAKPTPPTTTTSSLTFAA